VRLYVVYDLSGAGRLVGVFRSAVKAKNVLAVNPEYYRVTACRLNDIRAEAVDWLSSLNQQERVERLTALRQERDGF
jgi:hypothetical protein